MSHQDSLVVKMKLLPHAICPPQYKHPGDAGADVYAAHDKTLTIPARNGKAKIPTGICLQIPAGYEASVRPRSSGVLNTPLTYEIGTVDSGYRGEIHVIVRNFSDQPWDLHPGERLTQLVIAPVAHARFVEAAELDESQRGSGGFGSTGRD